MSSTLSQTAPSTPVALTTRNRIGLVLAVLLGLGDLSGLAFLGRTLPPGEQGPPDAVLIFGAVMGVVTVVAAVLGWRRRARVGLRVAAAARLLSMVTGLPAFFVDGVPAPVVAFTAVAVLVTLVTVALLVSRR